MSFDGMVTYAAVNELRNNLKLGKIEKIYQPQPEQLVFSIHTKNGNRKLFVSVSGNHSAAYLITKAPENPPTPPVFCMVLRKHLGAARITDIVQHENDRIIEIMLETVNEMGFSVNKKLIIEIMGKHSNVMLVDMESNRIIDSIKHISIDVNRARQILPGKGYEYPPAQDKMPFKLVTKDYMAKITENQPQRSRSILSAIQGVSPVLAETIAASASPYEFLQRMIDDIDAGNIDPVVYIDEQRKPVDFHITALAGLDSDYTAIRFDTLSEAVGYYFRNRESSNTVKQKSNDLMRIVSSHLDKLRLKTQRLNEDLYRAENSEKYRIFGELLTANLHLVKAGARSVSVVNYYDNEPVEIPLDPKFSPSRNAQNYYKKYGKAKTAVKEKRIQLGEVSREIGYLESVAQFISQANSIEEIEAIRQEMTDSGFIRYRKNRIRSTKQQKPKPYTYTLTSGIEVMAGRNNKENDWLTLKKASSSDLWFHTKDIPGTHVIMFTGGAEPDERDLFEAAAIAAYHSKGSGSENVPVDYTKVRYVKKPAGARPGMVIFTHNRTLYVNPGLPENGES